MFGGAAFGPAVIALPLTDQFALPKLAFTLLVSGVLLMLLDPRFAVRRWQAHPVPLVAAATLLALLALATSLADYPRQSVLGTYADYSGWLYYLPGVVAFAAAAALVRTTASLERLVSLLAVGAIPVLAYALAQVAGADPVSWDIDFGRRAFSTLGQPLVLGGYAATLLPLLIWLAMRRSSGERAFLLAEAAVAFAVLAATGTRGAYIGAVVAGVATLSIVVASRGVSQRAVVAGAGATIAAVILVALAAVTGVLPERMRSAETLGERTDLWRGGMEMAADRPVFGWGPDQFATSYGPYRPSAERGSQSPYEAPAASPHNETLQVLLAGGVPALLAYAAMWLTILFVALRAAARGRATGRRRTAAIALVAAVAAYLAQAQFSIPDPSLNVIAMTLLGSLAGLAPARRGVLRAPHIPAILGWAPRAIAPALGVAAVAMIAADYASTRSIDAVPSAAALRHAERASSINPLQARYLDELAATHDGSSLWGIAPRDARSEALATYDRRIERFGAGAATYLDAARIASRDRDSRARMDDYLERALQADPLNPGTPAEAEQIRRDAAR